MSRAQNPWSSLIGLCIVTALVWVTASDIAIALPAIGADIGGSIDELQWAVNAYFLAGSLIIVGGRVGDIYGRRLVFGIGTALIIIGSVVAGLAQSPALLIIGRVLEGIGAAAVLPTALAIIVVSFEGRARETAIAAWIATCWGAQALGPLVGGALVDGLGWRWVFWINIPLGIIALLWTWKTTRESVDEHTVRKVDYPGAITLVASIFLLSYALTASDTLATGVFVALLLGAVVLAVAFVLIERKVEAPVVVLSIFRKPRFNGAVLANLIANFVFGAAIFFMSLYLQVVEGKSALVAGALLLPATIPILLLNPIGTKLFRKFGAMWPTAIGMVLLAAAGYFMTHLEGDYSQLLLPFILLGAGIGLQITACAAVAVEDPGDAGEGVASGIYKASSMIGGSIGIAASTAVFQNVARRDISTSIGTDDTNAIENLFQVLMGAIDPSKVIANVPGDISSFITRIFDTALGSAIWLSIAASVIGVVLAVWLLRPASRRPY